MSILQHELFEINKKRGALRTAPDVRFWSKVAIGNADECWPWMAARMATGYGMIKWGEGRHSHKAHRVAYELTHGTIPDGMVVMHSCDNPSCVNPAHLSVGTSGDNIREMHAKGRRGPQRPEIAKARKDGRARIVVRLREIATERGLTVMDLHRLTGIAEPTLRRLWNNNSNAVELGTIGILSYALDVAPGELITRQ